MNTQALICLLFSSVITIDAFSSPSLAFSATGLTVKKFIPPSISNPSVVFQRGRPLFVDLSNVSPLSDMPELLTDEDELEFLRYVLETSGAEDIDMAIGMAADMQKKSMPETDDMMVEIASDDMMVGIASSSEGCAADIAIDVLALCLSIIKVPGGKSVANKLWKGLPESVQRSALNIIKKMDSSNFAKYSFELLKLIITNLSFSALKGAFKDFGLWDAAKFAGEILILVGSAGTAFIASLALNTVAIAELIVDIGNCDEI